MALAKSVANVPNESLRDRLGWGHRGFRVESRRAATIGLLLLLAIPFVLDQVGAQIRMAKHHPDLQRWLALASDVSADPAQQVYRPGGWYLYPPFFLALMRPLSGLAPWAAVLVFETLKWIALFFSLRFAWRLCAPRDEDMPPIVAIGSIIITWRFIWNDLGQGNVNLFILLAVLGACRLIQTRRDMAAGAVIAIAACVKVAPALLLVYFVYKGRWKSLVGAAAACVICLILAPALAYGWSDNLRLLNGWFDAVVVAFVDKGGVDSLHTNQSLTAIINRLFSAAVALEPDIRVTLIDLPQRARDLLRAGMGVSLLGLLGWCCRRRRGEQIHSLAFAAEAGLVLIVMLLMSGISWKAHFVTMLLPYVVLLAFLADARNGGPRRLIGGLLLTSILLCTFTGDLITPTGANYAEAYGVIAIGAMAAGIGLVVVRQSVTGSARYEP
ncbi:MAG: DUF2029 domain-containing protein [Planctomycetes bacterium]|nr:DUF2029 domain-containing protein [Planctomycetota bacterium]